MYVKLVRLTNHAELYFLLNSAELSDAYMSAIIYSDNGFSTVRRQDNQCGLTVNWTRNTTIFILENFFENVIWKMAALLPRPQCVTAKSSPDIWQFGSKRVDIYRIPSDCLLTIFYLSEHSPHEHYCNVIMGAMASQITSLTIVYSTVIQAQIKESIKVPRHWHLCGEFTGHRWIPRTNGQ